MVLRVRKEDSAYLYQVLESYEGLTNYSTLHREKGHSHCEVVLHLAPDLRTQVEILVENLRSEIEIEVLSNS